MYLCIRSLTSVHVVIDISKSTLKIRRKVLATYTLRLYLRTYWFETDKFWLLFSEIMFSFTSTSLIGRFQKTIFVKITVFNSPFEFVDENIQNINQWSPSELTWQHRITRSGIKSIITIVPSICITLNTATKSMRSSWVTVSYFRYKKFCWT